MLPVIQFRDPPPLEVRADELRRKIAEVLVNAPSLPVALRAGLTLADVEGQPGPPPRIDLRLRRDDKAFASILLEWPESSSALSATVRWDGGERSPENRALLDGMATRLRAAINADKWKKAADHLDEMLDLPRNVPMEAFRQLVPGV